MKRRIRFKNKPVQLSPKLLARLKAHGRKMTLDYAVAPIRAARVALEKRS